MSTETTVLIAIVVGFAVIFAVFGDKAKSRKSDGGEGHVDAVGDDGGDGGD